MTGRAGAPRNSGSCGGPQSPAGAANAAAVRAALASAGRHGELPPRDALVLAEAVLAAAAGVRPYDPGLADTLCRAAVQCGALGGQEQSKRTLFAAAYSATEDAVASRAGSLAAAGAGGQCAGEQNTLRSSASAEPSGWTPQRAFARAQLVRDRAAGDPRASDPRRDPNSHEFDPLLQGRWGEGGPGTHGYMSMSD